MVLPAPLGPTSAQIAPRGILSVIGPSPNASPKLLRQAVDGNGGDSSGLLLSIDRLPFGRCGRGFQLFAQHLLQLPIRHARFAARAYTGRDSFTARRRGRRRECGRARARRRTCPALAAIDDPFRSSSSYARFTVMRLTSSSSASARNEGSGLPGCRRSAAISRLMASTIC